MVLQRRAPDRTLWEDAPSTSGVSGVTADVSAEEGVASTSNIALGTSLGSATIGGVVVNYEQLMTILQHQHILEMRVREAEVASMQACIDMMAAGMPQGEHHLISALQMKEEQATISIAAKHKELELMAGLLQLREQQIEEFRQVCEAQRAEIEQLRQSPAPPGEAEIAPTQNGHRREEKKDRCDGSEDMSDNAVLSNEIRRLRARMEDLEITVNEQAQALKARGLGSPPSDTMSVVDSTCGHVPDPPAPACSSGPSDCCAATENPTAPSPASFSTPDQQHRHGILVQQHQQHWGAGLPSSREQAQTPPTVTGLSNSAPSTSNRAYLSMLRGSTEGGGRRQGDLRDAPAESHGAGPSPVPTFNLGHALSSPNWRSSLGSPGIRPAHALPADSARSARSERPLEACASSRLAEAAGIANAPETPSTTETDRQANELIREMRRLRQQMNTLERVAWTHETSGSTPFASSGSAAALNSGGRRSALPSAPSARQLGTSPRRTELSPSSLLGWEYRPHSSGDRLDAAIAAMVNRPMSRYHCLRSQLCRLEPGIYLCGARCVRLRVAEASESSDGDAILASEDGGRTWVDLEDVLRGASGDSPGSHGVAGSRDHVDSSRLRMLKPPEAPHVRPPEPIDDSRSQPSTSPEPPQLRHYEQVNRQHLRMMRPVVPQIQGFDRSTHANRAL